MPIVRRTGAGADTPEQFRVDCYAGHRGEEIPRRLFFDRRPVEVAKIISQWTEPNGRYFKILGDNGTIYLLRHATAGGWPAWELAAHPVPGR